MSGRGTRLPEGVTRRPSAQGQLARGRAAAIIGFDGVDDLAGMRLDRSVRSDDVLEGDDVERRAFKAVTSCFAALFDAGASSRPFVGEAWRHERLIVFRADRKRQISLYSKGRARSPQLSRKK